MASVLPARGEVVNFRQSAQSRQDMAALRKLVREASGGSRDGGVSEVIKLAMRFAAREHRRFRDFCASACAVPEKVADGS